MHQFKVLFLSAGVLSPLVPASYTFALNSCFVTFSQHLSATAFYDSFHVNAICTPDKAAAEIEKFA